MLNILWMIILIIILFIIILLILGIKVTFEYNKKGSDFKGCLKILVLKKIKIYTINFPDTPSDEKSGSEDEEKNRDYRKMLDLAKPCFRDLLDYVKKILETFKISKIHNHLIFGMDDYADTGKYIGVIWGVCAALNPLHKNLELSAEPRFTGSTLDGYGINEVEIYPLKMIVPTIRLVLKKEVRLLIKGVLDER